MVEASILYPNKIIYGNKKDGIKGGILFTPKIISNQKIEKDNHILQSSDYIDLKYSGNFKTII